MDAEKNETDELRTSNKDTLLKTTFVAIVARYIIENCGKEKSEPSIIH